MCLADVFSRNKNTIRYSSSKCFRVISSTSQEEDMEKWLSLSVEEAAEAEIPMVFASFSAAKDPSWEYRIPGLLH